MPNMGLDSEAYCPQTWFIIHRCWCTMYTHPNVGVAVCLWFVGMAICLSGGRGSLFLGGGCGCLILVGMCLSRDIFGRGSGRGMLDKLVVKHIIITAQLLWGFG